MNAVVIDLQDVIPPPQTNRNYHTNDDYSMSGYSDAFERHLERQEQERHKRYVLNLRKDMKLQPTYNEDPNKEIMYDQSNELTNGVTIQLSGDPMLSLHTKRTKIREQLKTKCYDDIMAKGSERKYKEGNGVSIEMKPDPKYTSVAAWCEKERKSGIEQQMKLKTCYDTRLKEMEKQEQENYRNHWTEVNRVADQIEISKRIKEANFVKEEMHKHEAKRMREYAEVQIEKERMKRFNQKISENHTRFDQNKQNHIREQKNEIRLALEEQMRRKREKTLRDKNKQKIMINS